MVGDIFVTERTCMWVTCKGAFRTSRYRIAQHGIFQSKKSVYTFQNKKSDRLASANNNTSQPQDRELERSYVLSRSRSSNRAASARTARGRGVGRILDFIDL